MKFKVLAAAAAACVGVLASGAAQAGVTLSFPSGGASFYSAVNGAGTLPPGGATAPLWVTGDYVSQTFSGTGLSNVSVWSENFTIWNSLNEDLTVDAYLNNVDVGSFTIASCGYCASYQNESENFTFAPIATPGGDVTLAFVLANTIDYNQGSIAFVDGGQTWLAAGVVPEPATWAMLILGVAMVGFAARRRNAGAAFAA